MKTNKGYSGVNWVGIYTLSFREINRFFKVYVQTVVAPVISTLLFYLVFQLVMKHAASPFEDVSYLEFLAPGLIMMNMVQNAFANTSSSLMVSKMQGNLTDVLLAPLGPIELTVSYMIGGIVRGLAVGVTAILILMWFHPFHIDHFGALILFSILGCAMLSLMGIASGIVIDKMDHISAVTNFIITPLTFLSGTFYTIDHLPQVLQNLTHVNPFFYMIDGFRYGFIGHADGYLTYGIYMLITINIILFVGCYKMFASGYRLKY